MSSRISSTPTPTPTHRPMSAEKAATRSLAIDLERFTRALDEIERKRGPKRDENGAIAPATQEANIQRCLDSIDRCFGLLGSEEIAIFQMPGASMPNIAMTEPAYCGIGTSFETTMNDSPSAAETGAGEISPPQVLSETATERFYRVMPNTTGGPRRPSGTSTKQQTT